MSQQWKVTGVVDGDTFDVFPRWDWGGQKGNRVRPLGYDAPEVGYPGAAAATQRLRSLVLGKSVVLRDPVRVDRGRLVCEVYLNGVNIARYFPEYAA